MSQIKSIHAGHRGRMRERFLSTGTQSLLPHQILEMLLFYAIPYKDTNPLAHNLLDTFGCLKSVLEAERTALMRHTGIGVHTADFLSDLSDYALTSFASSDKPIAQGACVDAVSPMLKDLHENGRVDAVSLVLIGNGKRLISVERLPDPSPHSAAFDPNTVVKRALDARASRVIIAHSHKNTYLPSPDDDAVTLLLRDRLALIGATLAEHYLITPHDCVPLAYRVLGTREPQERDEHRTVLFADAVTDAKRLLLRRRSDSEEEGTLREQKLARLLSYAIKGDTADMAKALLSKEEELIALSHLPLPTFLEMGMTETAATLVKLAPLAYAFALYDEKKRNLTFSASSIASLFVYRMIGLINETALIALFDDGGKLIDLLPIGEGSISETGISLRRLTESAHFHRARYACLAHNHPFGTSTPSPDDISTTKSVLDALAIADCILLEHFVTAGTSYTAVMHENSDLVPAPNGPAVFYDFT